ncbi:hypothetical protein NEPAR06_2245 [Nematocida parisii]|uniref:tRNA-intron lyase n=1 Tax=Nematocida parisii (strain ERTm3) TaxID=935791 RepID=I3EHZ9_NEMP3|nr:uncharacterized protein NEPG_02443 [Nematocida parisii ERTm1]EIJ88846.1 hypothetical protein NEQG_00665 [Nematocida parisii ERTm3]KAI5125791.1 hypothetical protein NEPAR03_0228 [Nematocida parisii]EIJ92752.1 hypothetical protein NEPG_02443 [Nematocida parisii ERTm1]KAI5129866.1 hypothetical protein NEPAR08_1747 [Nematocida parisii]KAI5142949.1 hypothetical protein NEPAR04_1689 [Nematocida parisii]|eukprot:XP_013060270.1 hypothetical protein NEPG_02443 [Nematocida parisii ERTm1]
MSAGDKRLLCGSLFNMSNVYLTSGIKYGTDFLVYLGPPKNFHSSFILNSTAGLDFKTIVALTRISSSTKKDFVTVLYDKTLVFVRFNRFFV